MKSNTKLTRSQKKELQLKFIKKHKDLFELLIACSVIDQKLLPLFLDKSERTIRRWINEHLEDEIEGEQIYKELIKKVKYKQRSILKLTDRGYYLLGHKDDKEMSKLSNRIISNSTERAIKHYLSKQSDMELKTDIENFIADTLKYNIGTNEYDPRNFFKKFTLEKIEEKGNNLNVYVNWVFTDNYNSNIGPYTEEILATFEYLILNGYNHWKYNENEDINKKLNIKLKVYSIDSLNITAFERATKHHKRAITNYSVVHDNKRIFPNGKIRIGDMDMYYFAIFNQENKFYILNEKEFVCYY